uniref:Uncharacterized protein n=1 Tax=Candidatus Kentrum sp. TC TaxID=2126339 RepID=A0A450ZJ09_9GAMM|nr:MAG: hypothetical protein BECKTC1821E_GA0114239_101343 [Candidatus Kentron sp. TC]VFK53754.1 MAG: hypothetical protein BECKTC1821F_GA0114240_100360 [Candidatus Kentron sp. TC]
MFYRSDGIRQSPFERGIHPRERNFQPIDVIFGQGVFGKVSYYHQVIDILFAVDGDPSSFRIGPGGMEAFFIEYW